MFRRTWQSPSNAHAYRLYVVNEPARSQRLRFLLAVSAAISEALDYDRFRRDLSNSVVFTRLLVLAFASTCTVCEDSHCSTLFGVLISTRLCRSVSTDENAPSVDGAPRYNSLTMSYFHTGTRTIIGAEAFHCPVRDGKEWDHLAMVIRHNFLPSCRLGQDSQFIESCQLAAFRPRYLIAFNPGITP